MMIYLRNAGYSSVTDWHTVKHLALPQEIGPIHGDHDVFDEHQLWQRQLAYMYNGELIVVEKKCLIQREYDVVKGVGYGNINWDIRRELNPIVGENMPQSVRS